MGNGALSGGNNLNILASGNVIFNGNVTLGGSGQVSGNINSGGNVNLGNNSVVNGYVRAAGTVDLGGQTTVSGNVDAGAASGVAVTLGNGTHVAGAVTHRSGTTVSAGSTATYGSNVIGSPAAPVAYVPTALAAATSFTAGTLDINKNGGETTNLGAGKYHDINLGSNNTLLLTAGNYYFNSLSMAGGGKIDFDLTGGAIKLFFAQDVNFGTSLDVSLLGGDASDIYTEVLGNWDQSGGGEWFGTVFGSAVGSDLHFGNNSTLIGQFIARDTLRIDGGSDVSLLQADVASVPEPSTLLLGTIALLGLAISRRRRA
jgi:hypothetical protein